MCALLLTFSLGACPSAAPVAFRGGPVAMTSPTARLDMAFTPYRLGEATTLVFGFTLPTVEQQASSPLAGVVLDMPTTVAYDTSTLGLASCLPAQLSRAGLGGCSPNSRIGFGTASVSVPFATQTLTETVALTTLVGNSENGHIEVLYYATGDTPVISRLILPGEIVSDASGEHIATSIPPIPTLPGAPDAAVVRFRATIGPHHLFYYERVHGVRVRYHPRGIALPPSCPHGGFPFTAHFTFQDGSQTSASDTIACPPRARGGGGGARGGAGRPRRRAAFQPATQGAVR